MFSRFFILDQFQPFEFHSMGVFKNGLRAPVSGLPYVFTKNNFKSFPAVEISLKRGCFNAVRNAKFCRLRLFANFTVQVYLFRRFLDGLSPRSKVLFIKT
jgi:hypothetical protein